MLFDRQQVLKLARLARLDLSPAEIKSYQKQLLEILNYVNKIKKLKLDKVPESLTGVEEPGVGPRPDRVGTSWPETIQQAAEIKDAYAVSPGVFEK